MPDMSEIRLSEESDFAHGEGPLSQIVKGRYFAVTFACLIVFSALLLGLETQLLSHQWPGSGELLSIVSTANYILTSLFTVEIVARLCVYRAQFFVKDRLWNAFDMIVVFLALGEVALDIWLHLFSGSEDNVFDNGGSAKLLRLLRLTRLLRLFRTFRQLRPLRMMVHSLYSAGKSVSWAFLLLITTVYAFGVILTQAVTDHTEGGTRVEGENLVLYFGTLHRSMLSLWMAISGGISWVVLTEPLERTSCLRYVRTFLYTQCGDRCVLSGRNRGGSSRFGHYH